MQYQTTTVDPMALLGTCKSNTREQVIPVQIFRQK